MRAYLHDLDEKCGNALKEFCQKYSVMCSYNIRDDNIYAVFMFYIDDSVMVLSNTKGVIIEKITGGDYVSIASDMFYYMEIL